MAAVAAWATPSVPLNIVIGVPTITHTVPTSETTDSTLTPEAVTLARASSASARDDNAAPLVPPPLVTSCLVCAARVATSLAAFLSTRGCGHVACHEHLAALPQDECPTCAATVDIFFGSSMNNVCRLCFEVVGDKIAIPDCWCALVNTPRLHVKDFMSPVLVCFELQYAQFLPALRGQLGGAQCRNLHQYGLPCLSLIIWNLS
jgi:hypothetical protein